MVNNQSAAAFATATAAVLRKARLSDVPAMLGLINGYAAQGIMLPRTEFDLSESIRDFTVAYVGDELAGCAALHFYTPHMAEVRSLAVSPAFSGAGIGRLLVEALLDEAREFSLDAVFAFTYVAGFFARLGFGEIERGLLPLKAWKDCMRCKKFASCDEIAVLHVLDAERWRAHGLDAVTVPDDDDVRFPILKSSSIHG